MIKLPRGHLSWSQLSIWEKSPSDYVCKYLLHQQQHVNSGMVFGKYVSEGLEAPVTEDTTIQFLRDKLPAYDTPEKKLSATWKGIPLLGYANTFREADHAFREYKTGRRDKQGNPPWNLRKARSHGQIAFYGFILWINDKKIPPAVHLDWIETKGTDGIVSLTNHIESFEVPITIEALLDIGTRIEKAANQISKEYKNYLAYVSKENNESKKASLKAGA